MMLIGLAGFGFVAYRRKSKPALAWPLLARGTAHQQQRRGMALDVIDAATDQPVELLLRQLALRDQSVGDTLDQDTMPPHQPARHGTRSGRQPIPVGSSDEFFRHQRDLEAIISVAALRRAKDHHFSFSTGHVGNDATVQGSVIGAYLTALLP